MKFFQSLLCLAVFMVSFSSIDAQTFFLGTISSNWFDPGNWTNGSPFTGNDAIIPAGVTVYIPSDLTVNYNITNNATIVNQGQLDLFGTMTNNAGLYNESTIVIRATGVINTHVYISNNGSIGIYPTGILSNHSGGLINNFASGLISSDGFITNLLGGEISNSGDLDIVSGTLTNGGVLTNPVVGDINNDGIIDNLLGGVISNNGQLNNLAAGTINNTGVINNEYALSTVSTILNDGIINNLGDIGSDGAITNNGTIDNGAIGVAGAIDNSEAFTNNGVINNFSVIEIQFTSDFNNSAGATINNQVDAIFQSYGFSFIVNSSGDFNNYGTLKGWYNNLPDGVITNQLGGTIDDDIYNSGTIDNYGTIGNCSFIDNLLVINNYGTIDNACFFSELENFGIIYNYGTIDNGAAIGGGEVYNNENIYNCGTYIGNVPIGNALEYCGCNNPLACNYDSAGPSNELACLYDGECNDVCADAIDLGSGDVTVTVDNNGATENEVFGICGSLSCASQDGWCTNDCDEDNGVWYSFLYTGISGLTISTINTGGGVSDSQLALFDGCPNAGGLLVAANDDIGGGDNMSTIDINCGVLINGSTYYVLVDTFSNTAPPQTGTCDLEITYFVAGCTDSAACNYDSANLCDDGSCTYPGCTDIAACNYMSAAGCDDGSCFISPVNDVCSSAEILSSGLTAIGDNSLACFDAADPSCGQTGIKDVWYSYTSSGGELTITTFVGSLLDTRIAVYDACGGTELYCNDDYLDPPDYTSQLVFPSVCGTTYYIQVGGFQGNIGSFDIVITENGGACTNPVACNYQSCAVIDDGSCILPDGCTDPLACNYDVANLCEDGSCTYPGCTELTACNYDMNAGCDDGSCVLPDGCADPTACNFDSAATCDDGSCILPDGCTDSAACNYDASYQCDNGSCILPDGCTDIFACNYNVGNLCDDGSCTYPGCMNISACNYDPLAGCDDGSCEYLTCRGCTSTSACNYDLSASIDDGTCEYASCAGCTYPNATNYDGSATEDNGTCLFDAMSSCPADLDGSNDISTGDLLVLLGVFGTVCP